MILWKKLPGPMRTFVSLFTFATVFILAVCILFFVLLSKAEAAGCDSSSGANDPVCDRVPTEWAAPNPDKSVSIDTNALAYIADSFGMFPVNQCQKDYQNCTLHFNILSDNGVIGQSPEWHERFVLDKSAKSGVYEVFDQADFKSIMKWLAENDQHP